MNWLRTFEAAARHLSFTAAARELGITQSAVSQQIRLLERHLGRTLFHRLPRGLAMAEAGEELVPLVSESFERLSAGIGEIFRYDAGDRVMVKATTGFAVLWLGPRLPRFHAAHPNIELRITTANWPADHPEVDVDLEIRYGTGAWPGLHADRLSWDEVFPVCSPGLRGGKPRLSAPADLAHHTLLHVIGFRDNWAQWLARAGVTGRVDATRGLEFDTSVIALDLAARGAGVALGRTCFLAEFLESGRLVAPFDLSLSTEEGFYLVRRSARKGTAAAEAFRAWLLDEAAEAEAVGARSGRGAKLLRRSSG